MGINRGLPKGSASDAYAAVRKRIDALLFAITIAIIVLIARSSAHAQLFWDTGNGSGLQSGNGTWSTGAPNWNTAAAPANSQVVWAQNSDAVFQTNGTSLVTVSGPVQVNSITFNGTGYTIGGTTLTLTGANITANADATISAILDGSVGLTKLGNSILTLSGANNYTGGTTLSAGTLRLSGTGTLGATTNNLTINAGTLDLNGTNQIVGALNGTGGTILNNSSGASSNTLTIGNGNGSGTFSGTITDHTTGSGALQLIKIGTGTETMTSTTSNYTGGTTINGGTIIANSANGGALGRGPVVVNNTGTLRGSGLIDATVTVNNGGTLAPGATASAGSIAKIQTGTNPGTGNVNLASGSNFILDLTAGAGPTAVGGGTIYDQLSVIGSVTLGGGSLTLNPGAGLMLGDKFFIVLNDSIDLVSGTFNNLPNASMFSTGGYSFLINYADNGDNSGVPNDISLTVQPTLVPEPNTWIGGGLALAGVGFMQRRRLRGLIARKA